MDSSDRKAITTWIILITVAAIAPYLFSLRGDFALDDVQLIVKDRYAHSLAYLPKAFTRDFLHGALGPNVIYYRPLVTVSFQINYMMVGPNPFGFRVTNLFLHVITALLVFVLARRLLKSLSGAGIAALTFAVLPAHAEAVGWISGRTDVMSGLFTLACVVVFARACESNRRFSPVDIVVCSLLALCAFFSKENALVLPFIMAAYVWIFEIPMTRHEKTLWTLAILASLAIFMVLRRSAVHVTLVNYPTLALGRRLLGVGIAYVSYLRMLFVPQVGRVVYDVFPIGMKYPIIALAAWCVPLGLIAASIHLRKAAKPLSFAVFWIFVTLLPVVNILPTTGPIPAERFVYLPSVGSAILLGWLGERIVAWRANRIWRLVGSALVVWFVLYCAALTVESCQPYSSDVAWARAISATNGRFFRSWAGYYFFKAGLYKEAAREYKAAIEHGSRDVTDYLGLANSLRGLGRHEEAKTILLRARQLLGTNAKIELNLGSIYTQLGDLPAAREAFERATKLNPKLQAAWIGLGHVNLRLGEFKKAMDAFATAEGLGGLEPSSRFEYAIACEAAGFVENARKQYEHVLRDDPEGEFGQQSAARLKKLGVLGRR